MDAFILFIQQYWQIILSSFTALLSVIIFLLKKKPQCNLLDVVYSKVLERLPEIICHYEVPGCGVQKKDAVLQLAFELFSKLLGRLLTPEETYLYKFVLSQDIENILSTPQKKGEMQDVQS